MLSRKKCSWTKKGDLLVGRYGFEGRSESDLGFAKTNISAKKAVHDLWLLHVGFDFINRSLLVRSQSIWELHFEVLLELFVFREGKAFFLGS